MPTRQKRPQIVLRNGKPAAVIIDIDEYRELLERLDDAEDLRELEEMRKRPLSFVKLEDFLSEHAKTRKIRRLRELRGKLDLIENWQELEETELRE